MGISYGISPPTEYFIPAGIFLWSTPRFRSITDKYYLGIGLLGQYAEDSDGGGNLQLFNEICHKNNESIFETVLYVPVLQLYPVSKQSVTKQYFQVYLLKIL